MRAPLVARMSSLALGVILALACGPDDPPDDPELRAACDGLCAAQIECDDTTLTMTECSNACIADVGFPGAACSAAIEALAACAADHCGDPAACSVQEADRTHHCGGTG